MDKLFDKLPYEKLENIKFAHLIMGAIGAGFVVILGYFFSLYGASQMEYEGLQQKKGQLESQLSQAKTLVARTETVSKEVTNLEGKVSDYKRQMPLAREMPGLLKQVGSFQKDLGVRIEDFRLKEGQVVDYYKEIPINMEIQGKFWNTMGFFDAMQDLLRVVSFTDLKMEVDGSEIETKFQIRTFAYIEGSELKAKAKKVEEKKEEPKKAGGH